MLIGGRQEEYRLVPIPRVKYHTEHQKKESRPGKVVLNFDGLVKSHEFNYRWLSKKVHIQGVVFFQERGYT
jgi:hypothetical protein